MNVFPIHSFLRMRVLRNMLRRRAVLCGVVAVIMAAVSLQACTKTEAAAVPDDEGHMSVPILFRPSADAVPAGKALIGPDNLTSETIVINDILVNDNGDADHYIADAEYSYKDGIWQTDGTRYWTKTGTHYFSAFIKGQGIEFVQGNDRNSDRLSLDKEFWNRDSLTLDVDTQPDILYAFAGRDMSSHNATDPVSLNFSHLFSAIKINITNVNRQPSLSVSAYGIDNVVSMGTFTLTRDGLPDYDLNSPGKNAYRVGDDNMDIKPGASGTLYAGKGKVDPEGRLLVWPQNLEDPELYFEYSDNGKNTYKETVSLKTADIIRWNAGFCYVYNIAMSDNNVNVQVQIVPWQVNDVIIEKQAGWKNF